MTVRRGRRARGAAVVLAWAVLARAARGDADAVPVEVVDCPTLDAREVERLLTLEVAVLVPDARSLGTPTVRLTCAGDTVRVELRDAGSTRHLARVIPAPSEVSGPPRVIALAVSQLLLTSWAELLAAPPPAPPTPTPPRRVVRVRTISVRPRETPRVPVALVGATRVHFFGAPFASGAGALRVGVAPVARWEAYVQLGLDDAGVVRARGVVQSYAGDALLGAAWHSGRLGAFTLDARAGAGAAYLALRATASRADVAAGALAGFSASVAASLGPTVHLGPFAFGLEAQAGALFPAVVGRVSQEPAVSMGGAWFGLAASAGVVFGGG